MNVFEQTGAASKINRTAETFLNEYQLAGLSIGVVKDSKIVLERGYGYSSLETKTPATEKTVYRIASVTKQFTAAAVMQLVERGKLNTDDRLTKFFPGYPAYGRDVTVHNLLTHTSGIKNYTALGARWESKSRLLLSHEEFIEIFKNEPFDFAPNQRFSYSNSGYRLLGIIIEKVSGESYSEYLRKHIFTPLKMTATTANERGRSAGEYASSYEFTIGGRRIDYKSSGVMQTHAAGAIYSNVIDLLKWQKGLNENKIISRESYDLMTTPAVLSNKNKIQYGYGFGIDIAGGRTGHSGELDGFRSQLSYYPGADLTIVVLSNTASAVTDNIEKHIAGIIFDQQNR